MSDEPKTEEAAPEAAKEEGTLREQRIAKATRYLKKHPETKLTPLRHKFHLNTRADGVEAMKAAGVEPPAPRAYNRRVKAVKPADASSLTRRKKVAKAPAAPAFISRLIFPNTIVMIGIDADGTATPLGTYTKAQP